MNNAYLNIRLISILLIIGIIQTGCNVFDTDEDEETYGRWTEVSSFEGVPRSNAVSFTINGKAYLGTGFDGDDRLNDFWQYDPVQNFWIQKADLPGPARSAAAGFSIADKGYIGTGYNEDAENDRLKDFWEYDVETNTWTQKEDFGGSGRYGAVSFSLGDRGYIGTGNDDNYLKDFWAYNPENDSWDQIISIPGDKRIDAISFVIDGKAYVGTGKNNGVFEEDFWVYDPDVGNWSQLNDIDEDEDGNETVLPRSNAVGFELNGKGYIAMGDRGGSQIDVWEYDPVNDAWNDELEDIEALGRVDAVSFSIDGKAYIGTGLNGTLYLDDFWEFDPTLLSDEDDE